MGELIWKQTPWVRTTLDEDELERQRVRAILAKLPPPDDDDQDDESDEEEQS